MGIIRLFCYISAETTNMQTQSETGKRGLLPVERQISEKCVIVTSGPAMPTFNTNLPYMVNEKSVDFRREKSRAKKEECRFFRKIKQGGASRLFRIIKSLSKCFEGRLHFSKQSNPNDVSVQQSRNDKVVPIRG